MEVNLKPKYVPISENIKKVEILRRWADISKAYKIMGFKPKFHLKEGLVRLIEWLKTQEKVGSQTR